MRLILKNINDKIKKNISIPFLIATFCFILLNFIIISEISKQTNEASESFRIHIVANSNNIDDQKLKYLVKDKIINYLKNNIDLSNITNKNDSKEIIKNNIENILEIAKNEINNNGYNYNVSAKIGRINYETKLSDYYSMPAGSYDAVEITIGEGKGKNWWSLIYSGSLSIPDNYFKEIDSSNFETRIR